MTYNAVAKKTPFRLVKVHFKHRNANIDVEHKTVVFCLSNFGLSIYSGPAITPMLRIASMSLKDEDMRPLSYRLKEPGSILQSFSRWELFRQRYFELSASLIVQIRVRIVSHRRHAFRNPVENPVPSFGQLIFFFWIEVQVNEVVNMLGILSITLTQSSVIPDDIFHLSDGSLSSLLVFVCGSCLGLEIIYLDLVIRVMGCIIDLPTISFQFFVKLEEQRLSQ